MLIVVMFITLALLCCAITAVSGGKDGRWAAFMTVATVLIDRAIGSHDLALATSPGFRLLLDGTLLLGYAALMLASRRFWPVWITGFQMNAVLAHLTTWLVPHYTPVMYRGLESFWGIPIVLTMAWGAMLDARAAVARP